MAAEEADYVFMTKLSRYTGYHIGFIDSKTINDYKAKYNSEREQTSIGTIQFRYTANATQLAQIRVSNTNGKTITFYGPDNLTPLTSLTFEHAEFRVFNETQTGYTSLSQGFDLTFYNCYIVEMKLDYTAFYGPTNGLGNFVHQIVILNQDLVPIWIGIDSSYLIS
jgi:hypothetical protein